MAKKKKAKAFIHPHQRLPTVFFFIILTVAFTILFYAAAVYMYVLPPPGCKLVQVQCIQAPCFPQIVCSEPVNPTR